MALGEEEEEVGRGFFFILGFWVGRGGVLKKGMLKVQDQATALDLPLENKIQKKKHHKTKQNNIK